MIAYISDLKHVHSLNTSIELASITYALFNQSYIYQPQQSLALGVADIWIWLRGPLGDLQLFDLPLFVDTCSSHS